MTDKTLTQWTAQYHEMLVDDVAAFWMRYSPDEVHGGIYSYLERDGSLLSTDKAVWLQGRAVWTFARMYNTLEPNPQWLEFSNRVYDFLVKHCFDADGRMFFSVTEDGKPLRKRRYLFSETFAIIGFAENARANNDVSRLARAIDLFRETVRRHRTPDETMPPKTDPATRRLKSHSMPMILLSTARSLREVCGVMCPDDPVMDECNRVIDEAIAEVRDHFYKPEMKLVLETVFEDGSMLDTPEGRTVNPGHAIETSWFLLEEALERGDHSLRDLALSILRDSLEIGWDDEHGGILYFVDARGLTPDPMEHDMKLWWPHCEAMYATLLAYKATGDAVWLEWHVRARDWTMARFPDAEHGEWYGYLNRDGSLSKTIKGNMWKGPFHIPRALLKLYELGF